MTEEIAATYISSGCIRVHHYRAFMNCYTNLSASLNHVHQNIIVTDTETGPSCFCMGYFDLLHCTRLYRWDFHFYFGI